MENKCNGDDKLKHFKDLLKLYATFFRIGAFTFGGGYAMLPMIEKEVVEKNKWATMEEVMDYFAISQCTPGVIAVNLATFIGYKTKGIWGAFLATIGVITPSIIIISLIAGLLKTFNDNPYVESAFQGIGVAVCAILVSAIIKIGKTGLVDIFTCVLAGCAFLASAIWDAPTVLVIIASGILGLVYINIRKIRSKKNGGDE